MTSTSKQVGDADSKHLAHCAWAEHQRKLDVSAAEVYRLLQDRELNGAQGKLPRMRRVLFEPGQRIFEIGQIFDTLAIVRLGFFKTVTGDGDGTERVVGFPMRGSIIGIEGIDTGRHQSCAQALTSGELILVPYPELLKLRQTHPDLQACIFKAISAELEIHLSMIRLLASRHAEARIARFLVWLGARHGGLGYSDSEYYLRMRRCDISSLLGVTLETVCRTLTTLRMMGIIEIKRHHLRIIDLHALSRVDCLPSTPARLKQIEANRLRRRILRQRIDPTLH